MKNLKLLAFGVALLCAFQSKAQFSEGSVSLYVSKQTGEFSTYNGSRSKTTDQYESGSVTITKNGPIDYNLDPNELNIGPNQTKTWNGTLFPNVAQAPAPGNSVDASITGNWDVTFSRPVGAGSGGTVISTYTCTGCEYHGTNTPGDHEIVNKVGTEVVPITVYSIEAKIPDVDTLCVGATGGPLTAEVFPPHGGSFEWTVTNPNVHLIDADKQTVKVALNGAPGVADLKVKWTIEGVSYSATRNIYICGKADNILVKSGSRGVNAGDTLDVVPPLVGKTIDLKAVPAGVIHYCPPDPNWDITGFWTSTAHGPTTSFTARGYNAAATMLWLFNYIPKTYNIALGDRCGGMHTATVRAYPVNEASISWKFGQYFKKAEDVWNALPNPGCEPTLPGPGSSLSFHNGWKEKSTPEAYLWWKVQAGFNPLIGFDCKVRLCPGPVPVPLWITNYLDLGLYLTLDGNINFNAAMERLESGVTGTAECAGSIGGGLLGVVRAGDLVSLSLSGHMNFIEASLKIKAENGWILYKVEAGSGKLEATISFETWGGWIEFQRTWLIWDGVNWTPNATDHQLYQYSNG